MSEPKFTKGPWQRAKYQRMIIDSVNNPIAYVHYQEGPLINKTTISFDEALANAALIIAAPDLYAALEKTLSFIYKDNVKSFGDEGFVAAIDEAEAALKKARGE